MATSKNSGTRKSSTSRRTTASKASKGTRRTTSSSKGSTRRKSNSSIDSTIKQEIIGILLFFMVLFLFLCVINVIGGAIGPFVKGFVIGIFGILGYVLPIAAFAVLFFKFFCKDININLFKVIAAVLLIFVMGILLSHFTGQPVSEFAQSNHMIKDLYDEKAGGGVIFGLLAVALFKLLGNIGSILFAILLAIICIVILTGKSLSDLIRRIADEASAAAREYDEQYEEDDDDDDYDPEEERRQQIEERKKRRREKEQLKEQKRQAEIEKSKARQIMNDRLDDDRIVNSSRSKMNFDALEIGSTVSENASLGRKVSKDDIHEITINPPIQDFDEVKTTAPKKDKEDLNIVPIDEKSSEIQEININKFSDNDDTAKIQEKDDDLPEIIMPVEESVVRPNIVADNESIKDVPHSFSEEATNVSRLNDTPMELPKSVTSYQPVRKGLENGLLGTENSIVIPGDISSMPEPVTAKTHENNAPAVEIKPKPKRHLNYKFPPIDLLKINKSGKGGDSDEELKKTALKLQNTLKTFGVDVTVTDISQGPSVTRYELSLGEGVKVNKILSLTDDIKLNMAAQDIRIEAPIPGKAAVGIEMPNKETSAVLIRDLLDTNEFKSAESKLTFAVGKDISGKTIVADIAKMPHMLVAGATGSGKSVCINTLIMSILYEANPDDVKLIMIDPKVVELSVYNGIPHLLLPVVTDPRKASATLQWAVNEMTKRYNAFASFGVRDLKGYNAQVENLKKKNKDETAEKLPQIIVIVDELADLMMVASKEVEESICRLAQLARAAGIHLIIATQRPSVDVITGLIKANMPSRVAFKVTSGVDSRTILDMIGAEKLLGKGDMLFYPQGYTKPLRVQGAFVSDDEVNKVVEFLKENTGDSVYDSNVENEISSISSAGGKNQGSGNNDNTNADNGSDYDQFFAEACRLVATKEKASSGMLQRVYKIGFNRAARIIDQMEEAGVVGPEEGTKPRRVLMSVAEVEEFIASLK